MPTCPPKILKRLRKVDRRLDVKFDETRKRWKVYEKSAYNGRLSYCFTWQGPRGEYRPLTSAEPLLTKLREIDLSRYKNAGSQILALQADLDNRRQNWLRSRWMEWMRVKREYASDLYQRTLGVRQTFGSGPPRKRLYVPSINHRDWLQHMEASRGGAAGW